MRCANLVSQPKFVQALLLNRFNDGSKDSFGSIMTKRTMENYVEDCNSGIVLFMRDHSEGVDHQLGRIVSADYNESENHVRATVSMLRDTEDTPDDMKINEYLRVVSLVSA